MLKKITSILLVALILLPGMLTGCSESTENADPQTAETLASAEPAGAAETPEEAERLYADIPADANYDGYAYTILCSSNSEYSVNQNDFKAEEMNGEAINDARFNRNAVIGDLLNVTINTFEPSTVSSDAGATEIKQDVQAGTGAFDMAACCGYATSSLALDGFLYDMKKVPYLDLEKPWWDQVANESLTVLDQLFYTTGDLTTSDNDATYCILFNKQLITDYNMANPYEMVDNGTWTLDNFTAMAEQVSGDLNGDGVRDKNDRFGVIIWDDSMMGIVNCTGEKCCSVNGDGLLSLTLNSEKTVNAVSKFLDFAANKDIAYAYQRYNWTDQLLVDMFCGDQSLFIMQLIQIVPKFREMDTDFGILPYFKYDEAQTEYYTTIGSWHSVFVCVPSSSPELERTGVVMEAMANESLYGLTDAYYDKTLKGKTTRDVESSAMLDIIFSRRVYDMGWYYGVANFHEDIMNLFRNDNNNFASMYKIGEKVAKKLLEKNNNKLLEVKEKLS